MAFMYDVRASVQEAMKDCEGYTKDNFQKLLNKYLVEINAILKQYGGIESNIPMGHKYFYLKNKHQYVHSKFTKE